MRVAVVLLVLVICACGNSIQAQFCNPAVVSYLVRDEKGELLTEKELQPVYEGLPKKIGDAHTQLDEVSFADDGITFYWPESEDWKKGKKVPALKFLNYETCTLHFTEVTLNYHQRSMRLVFNIDIERKQSDRRPVVDSLPFQEGTFELDLNGWPREEDKMIPSARWKRVKDKP